MNDDESVREVQRCRVAAAHLLAMRLPADQGRLGLQWERRLLCSA